jgi:2-oxoglutarate ferredoxin oxidoreductase subunit beta
MDDTAPRVLKPKDYKTDLAPIWCPGCGHFGVFAAMQKAFADLAIAPEDLVMVSGIGCSSRLPAYTNAYGFHGVHGRALAVATGVKVARPELTVVAVGGDGDGFSIGGNHFLHACRRNVDLTYIVMDNEIYGMTKGQPSPTTPPEYDTALTPGGSGIGAFQPAGVALSAGADFIARAYAGDPIDLARMVTLAIAHPGFSFLHVLSQCVTYRPDEREWKHQVERTEQPPAFDRAEAAHRMMTDDKLTTGVLYVGNRGAYARPPVTDTASLDDIERDFAL